MENQNSNKRDRDDSAESEAGSPEVKRLRDDLLGFFDDSDPEPATQDLDSLMRSFEEEIATASSSPVPVVDLTADSGESQPELGYLLEASDDELGLPPSNSRQEFARVSTDSSEIGEMWRFEDQIPNYDAFELEGGDVYSGSDTAEYVAFDGLMEYSNLCFDSSDSSDFLWHKASHVALECTLQSHPNMVILGEEVAASKLTLSEIAKQITDAVQARAEQDKYHGVILLPEGLIESIPEVYALLKEIHGLLRQGVAVDKISSQLTPWASALFEFLPPFIRRQLLLYPESDDSAQLSQIETEKLLAYLVEVEINKRLKEGTYKGKKFNAICHFFGYQARGSLPSKFDCDYAYVLGHICYHILAAGLNGYMATVTNLKNPVNKWRCGAAPIASMMTVKRWSPNPGATSIGKPAIHPATVDLRGKAYELLRQKAQSFLMDDIYRNPGPLQFDGPGAGAKVITLSVEDQDYMGRIKKLQEYLEQVRTIVKPGCPQEVLKAALSVMASVTEVLAAMSTSSTNTLSAM